VYAQQMTSTVDLAQRSALLLFNTYVLVEAQIEKANRVPADPAAWRPGAATILPRPAYQNKAPQYGVAVCDDYVFDLNPQNV